jgi:hypothetical protein
VAAWATKPGARIASFRISSKFPKHDYSVI